MKFCFLFLFLAPVSCLRLTIVARPSSAMVSRTTSLAMGGESPEPTQGIQGMLGGGKTSDQIEVNEVIENGSKVAFAIVLAALVYGGTNEEQVASIAKSQKKPCVEKISNGKKIVCPTETASINVPSAFPNYA
eukprot:CAMPEP_0115856692 /NCGR_PEP_ID=MMETSP0287-20121206/15185_1 /TAXON_ID=412157 /ORGANISM="Chrysochromulina rotalis, Strain UIO044" /LENGTH=132 /DNA_ID=CAMNT_0003310877 /DNA_START=28 /DNA_END=426 /DNA_ORIENTATION=+